MTSSTLQATHALSKSALTSYLSATPTPPFRIVRTISQSSNTTPTVSAPYSTSPSSKPRTLFILDSSFNPPSLAHVSLALSALHSKDRSKYPSPHRLLLLFSVHNADKKATPAPFEDRIGMMFEVANDILDMNNESENGIGVDDLEIDIGLTNKPYYNDKSSAIVAMDLYPENTQHVHITGFDTVIRIFDPKYYEGDAPLSVLEEFFNRHRLRVTVRGEERGLEEQLRWAQNVLGADALEKYGAQSEWAERIEMVEFEDRAKGVSSTKIREAVASGDWDQLQRLCTPRVAGWIREFGLYANEGGNK